MALATVTLTAAALAACGATSTSSGGTTANAGAGGSSLVVADLAPFSGPDAALGPTYLATCYGATTAINSGGGVLGHKLTCKSVDTRGDPADAVPAVNQLFATTSSVALVIGCTSDEAASSDVQPITSTRLDVVANIWLTAGTASAGSPLVSTLLQASLWPSTPPALLMAVVAP